MYNMSLSTVHEGREWTPLTSDSTATSTAQHAGDNNKAPSAKTQAMNKRAEEHRASRNNTIVFGIITIILSIMATVFAVASMPIIFQIIVSVAIPACFMTVVNLIVYLATFPPSFYFCFAKLSPEALLVDDYNANLLLQGAIDKADYMSLKENETKQLEIKHAMKQEDAKQLELKYQMMLLQGQ